MPKLMLHAVCAGLLWGLSLLMPTVSHSGLTNWIEQGGLRFAKRVDFGTVSVKAPQVIRAHLKNVGSTPLWIERLSPT